MENSIRTEGLKPTYFAYCDNNPQGRRVSLNNLQRLFHNIADQLLKTNREVLSLTTTNCPACHNSKSHFLYIGLK